MGILSMDKSERYLKDIAKNTAEIAKELKRTNTKEASKKKLAEQQHLREFTKDTGLTRRADREKII